jgi:hypothetical protein
VGPINVALWFVGVVLIAIGYRRAAGPYRRYMALREQDANVARYEAWRGGSRPDARTGASIAMQLLRRQAMTGGAVLGAGVVIVLLGFVIR